LILTAWLTNAYSRGHQPGSSGANTPVAEGTTTPSSDQSQLEVSTLNEDPPVLAEKLRHRNSFQKARLVSSVHLHLQSAPLSKEHQEQGRVKIEVYTQYIQAASKFGFVVFLSLTVAQQALSVFATLVLRYWGEHNRKVGGNSGMLEYLVLYGGFSFSSILLGALSAILLWVYCALQSARHLHDSVSTLRVVRMFGMTAHLDTDVAHLDACTSQLL
jgi:ATP-binding cassette subfamily C (CFTR/MRP) protein 1